MMKILLLVCLLVLSCTSRKVATGKPENEPVRIVEPQEVNLNSTVLHRIINLKTIVCKHITESDSIIIDSPTFDLIPDEQKLVIRECAQNAGVVLDFMNYFPDDGRKFMDLTVKGNWESDMLQLHILERTFEKKGVVSVYSLKNVGGKYEIEKLVSTFSI